MRVLLRLAAILPGLVALAGGSASCLGQPSLPRDQIPAGAPPEVRAQIERLYAPSPVERGYAAWALGNLGERAASAIPFLISLLGDDTPLQIVVTPPGYAVDTTLADQVARALAAIGPPATAPLAAFVGEGKQVVWARYGAVRALAQSKDPNAAATLLGLLDRAGVVVCDALRKSRWDYGWAVVGKVLVAGLTNRDVKVRRAAAPDLGGDNAELSVKPLIAALSDPDRLVRSNAAYALTSSNDRGAVPALLKALKDPDPGVREAVAWALKGVTGQDFGQDRAKWQRWWDQHKPSPRH